MAEISEELVMVCPYWLRGTCPAQDDDCHFAHEMTSLLPKDVPCEYYLKGYCKYKNCYYSHSKKRVPRNIGKRNVEKSESSDSNVNNDVKIKNRFSFSLNFIRKKRKARKIENMSSELPSHYTGMLKNPHHYKELPMDNCVHYDLGKCPLGIDCPCSHGNLCDICQKYCMVPNDRDQNRQHTIECEKALEKDMQLSFGLQCSKDKICGICLESILEKEKFFQRRFGILENCDHVFCIQCINEWRRRGRVIDSLQAGSLKKSKVMRACPTCRVVSDFVLPSNFWFDNKKEKGNMIAKYKAHMKSKPCKYFDEGIGTCPFGNRCFYLHATPDGTVVILPPYSRRQQPQNRPADAVLSEELILWHYATDRGDSEFQLHEFEDIMDDIRLGDADSIM